MVKNGRKQKQQGRKQRKQQVTKDVDERDLNRFAGSSDEDDEAENVPRKMLPPPADEEVRQQQADIQKDKMDRDSNVDDDDDEEEDDDDNGDDDSSIGSFAKEEDPATKMANVIGQILGGQDKKITVPTTNVVLGKTVTPLQKLQQQEREKAKALKQKRQETHRERTFSALHYPLSIATSNNVATEGRLSVAKELEQERFHRRVATRGVVALFNAISQHQRSQLSGVQVRRRLLAGELFWSLFCLVTRRSALCFVPFCSLCTLDYLVTFFRMIIR
jgi:Rrp15p